MRRVAERRRVVLVAVVLLGACGVDHDASHPAPTAAAGEAPVGPLTPTDRDRITPQQRAAIVALAASSSEPPDPSTHQHVHHGAGPATTIVLSSAEQSAFDRERAIAASAALDLETEAERRSAGYVRAAVQGAGVGVHWVNWTLVDGRFDPARPAMLLVDERDGRADLVGFGYWLRADESPAGFSGANDEWHRHTNLCVVNGWVDREDVASAAECAGDLLAGSDLWMLHAWIVPGRPNRWGDFAVRHPALCPSALVTPDIGRCPSA